MKQPHEMPDMKVSKYTDKEIIESVIKGQAWAQKELFERFAGKMMTVSLRYSKNQQQAEDILQDSFIKVFKYLKQFKFNGSFEGWIRTIVVHTALKAISKKSAKMEIYGMEDHVPERVELPEAYWKLEAEEIMKIIETLPDGYRIVFNMFAVEGFSHKEIALKLGIGESTSRSQYLKARKMLRGKLEELNKIAV